MAGNTQNRGVVAITGGSSGIGLATAELFARRGWHVGLIARGAGPLEAARIAVLAAGGNNGGRVVAHAADVTDSDALRQAATAIAAGLGPIDVWINNAGVSVFAPFADVSEREFERVTDVVYMGTVRGTRVALEHMRPRDAGVIVNICSAIGLRGVPLQSAYSGAKYALRGFAEAIRAELAHEGSRVRVTTVYPPSVNTPFYSHATGRLDGLPRPPPPIYQPELVADAIFFAATNRRRDVLVGGQTVQTGLLNALAPGLADLLSAKIAPRAQTSHNQGIADARDENLFTPSTRSSGTHGAFDRESLPFSAQAWGTMHRGTVGAMATFGLATLGLMLLPRRR